MPTRPNALTTFAALLVAVTAPIACTGASAIPARAATPLAFELAGCAAVPTAGACELADDGALRVWVDARPAERVTFELTGIEHALDVRATPSAVGGGTLYKMSLPLGARTLTMRGGDGGATEPRRGVVRFVEPPATWVREARSRRRKGDVEGAERLAKAGASSAVPGERGVALGLLARIELGRGNAPRAIELFHEARAAHREAGRGSDLVDDGVALAYTLSQRGRRYAETRAVLDAVEGEVGAYAAGAVRLPYYRAQLAVALGDSTRALVDIARVRAGAQKLGMDRQDRDARGLFARQLRQLGRWDEAVDELRALVADVARADDASACERLQVGEQLGAALLDRAEAATSRADVDRSDAFSVFSRALDASQTCSDPEPRALALEGLGLALVAAGRPLEARARIAEARASIGQPCGGRVLRALEIEGRAALAEGRAGEALARFDEQHRLASASFNAPETWRAMTARGEALDRLGRTGDALRAYERAEALLDDGSVHVPLGDGRDTFVGGRDRSARLAVDLLLRQQRAADALVVARGARARMISGVERAARLAALGPDARLAWENAVADYKRARDAMEADASLDWRLSTAEVVAAGATRLTRERASRDALDGVARSVLGAGATPGPRAAKPALGEVWLAYFPTVEGWAGFVVEASRLSTFHFELPATSDPTALAATLLEPARRVLSRAGSVTVLPYGPLRAVDFHALPWDGAPLVAALPVRYSLDLAVLAPGTPAGGPDLVIADPSDNLTAGREEVTRVAARLPGSVRRIEGRDATRDAVLRALLGADHVHYAGHGVFAGTDATESALLLARGERLSVGDILSLERAPSRVVLSGCETARSSSAGASEGLGVAQAFLAAGSRVAIAPVRAVRDDATLRLVSALYASLARADVDPAEALRRAQLDVRGHDDTWSAFRVITR